MAPIRRTIRHHCHNPFRLRSRPLDEATVAKSSMAGMIPFENGLASVASPNGFLGPCGNILPPSATFAFYAISIHNDIVIYPFRSPSRLARIFLYGSPLPHHCHTIATIGNTIAPVPQCDNSVTPLAHIRTIPGILFHNTDYATIGMVRSLSKNQAWNIS